MSEHNGKSKINDGFTCAIYRGDKLVFCSKDRGIKPVLSIIDGGIDVKGCRADDRIVGAAAALLYIHLGVASVYADVMSERAKRLLCDAGIDACCGVLVQSIINRKGDGVCPMEAAVDGIEDSLTAIAAIRNKLKQLA